MLLWTILLLLMGLIFLLKGSDWFVESAVWLAAFWRVPQMIIGAVLVSACTTLPEMVVSVGASLMGNSSLALGNAIGSIAFNTGFILATIIVFARPSVDDRRTFFQNGLLLLALMVYLIVNVRLHNGIPKGSGLILLGLFILFVVMNIKTPRKEVPFGERDMDRRDFFRRAALFVIGAALTFIGARLFVGNAQKIAECLGLSDSVVGLTIAAVGTSLPELITAITALRKGACHLCIGNILGANIYNILLVIALSAMVGHLRAGGLWMTFYIPLALLIQLTLLLLAMVHRERFTRLDGIFLWILYGVYFVLSVWWV